MIPAPKHDRCSEGDRTPVSGGCGIPAKLRRQIPQIDPIPADEITLHVTRLFVLHPELALRFGNTDLTVLDDSSKEKLLDEINCILKISRFHKAEL